MASWQELSEQSPTLAEQAGHLLGLDARGEGKLVAGDGGRGDVRLTLSAGHLYTAIPEGEPIGLSLLRQSSFTLAPSDTASAANVELAGSAALIVYAYERESVLRALGSTGDADDLVFRLDLVRARQIGSGADVTWSET